MKGTGAEPEMTVQLCPGHKKKMNVAVIGGYKCSKKIYKIAEELGSLVAQQNWVVICGGGSGVMEAVSRGAKREGGITVGILPSFKGEEANPYLDVEIPTGLGYARNFLIVRAADCLVAVDGKYGTLSEIAFALNEGKRVYGIDTWDIKGIIKVKNPQEVIRRIKKDFNL